MKNFEFAVATGPGFGVTLEHLKNTVKNNAELVKRNMRVANVFAITEMVAVSQFEQPVPGVTVVLVLEEDTDIPIPEMPASTPVLHIAKP